MNEMISMHRLGRLVRNDSVRNFRTVMTVSALFVAIVAINNLVVPDIASVRNNFYVAWFAAVLFVWGLLATSRAFRDLHDKTRNEAYLLIPASSLEKTLARLLYLTVIFVLFLLGLTLLLSLALEAMNAALGRQHNVQFNPLDARVWKVVAQYLIVQSYFFLGAAWFRRTHFVKTSLTITVTLIALLLIAFASTRLFLGSHWWNNIGSAIDTLYLAYRQFVDGILALAQLVAFIVIPAVCWYTAFLRVRETQVSDGV